MDTWLSSLPSRILESQPRARLRHPTTRTPRQFLRGGSLAITVHIQMNVARDSSVRAPLRLVEILRTISDVDSKPTRRNSSQFGVIE